MNNQLTLEEAYNLAIDFEADVQVIGIQKEKVLHRTLKYYLCNDEQYHEIKVSKESKGVLFADIKIDNQIYEIQTRSFNALREKLAEFLKKYQVTVVYPIASHKTIFKINDENHLISNKKSPKKGNPLEIFYELYKIKIYLNNPNLSFKIIMLDMDEYRKEVKKKHYRSSGYERIVQIPKKIERIINLKSKDDYLNLLNEYQLNENFISKEFAKATHLTIKKAGVVLNVLTSMEIISRIGKVNRSYLYRLNKQ